ncbi:MAG: gliding motility-associated C-terminal domain-containing protein [Vicingaceae bacterium]|nr:gliding motility-associated C-terminal domain-containing protein [Vicingaceae bacterium]
MLNFKNILLCVQFPKTREYKPFIKFFLLFIIQNLTFNISSAQNLVFNGDFEIYDTCPTNISTPGDLQIEHCTGWTAPTKLGTSDYFNVCNNATTWQFAGVPQNLLGYQQPLNGNGYCGFLAFDATFGTHYREYLQTKLINPLETGKNYRLSFYVVTPFVGYTVSKIGALFSANDFNSNTYAAIVDQPQVINTSGFLTDTLNWIKIEGEFVADGNEQFLTIGYFVDTTFLFTNDTLNTSPDSILVAPMSYYYVDGVELVEVEFEVIIPNIFTPNADGMNDLFVLNFPYEKVEIYNRWGQKLFESNNNESFWDGKTTSGNIASEGTYYYIITTKENTYKGFIQLLR